ncbi:MAG: hypothetical protein A2284_04215 [Deltaproteobacteria bacterium RIFOXYA12_FULL_61_11]|nr:MAG: hypothetical protein A2284_04215 [Deltaproteobacteria bacterium RIFOXYA12_FULL_61_11]
MKKLILVLAFLFLSGSVYAGGYGAAGCGLGSLVFGEKNGIGNQILAMTTNSTFGSQLFGISTGTLNCDAEGLFVENRTQEAYVKANLDVLTKEMAQGQGEHLSTLGHILGCSEVDQFNSLMHRNYETIHNAPTMLEGVKQTVVTDGSITCTLL